MSASSHELLNSLEVLLKKVNEHVVDVAMLENIAEHCSNFSTLYPEIVSSTEYANVVATLTTMYSRPRVKRFHVSHNASSYIDLDDGICNQVTAAISMFIKAVEAYDKQALAIGNVEHPFVTQARELFDAIKFANNSNRGLTISREQLLALADNFDSFMVQREKKSSTELHLNLLRHEILIRFVEFNKTVPHAKLVPRLEVVYDNPLKFYFYTERRERLTLRGLEDMYGKNEVIDKLIARISDYFERHPDFKVESMGIVFEL